MSFLKKLIALFLFFLASLGAVASVSAGAVDLDMNNTNLFSVVPSGGDALDQANDAGFRMIGIAKVIINGAAIIFIVYAGLMMVVSSADEDKVKKAKTTLWHTVIAFIFINIPGQLANFFSNHKAVSNASSRVSGNGFAMNSESCDNLILCPNAWKYGPGYGILSFIQVGLISATIFLFSLAAFKIIANRGNEEERKKVKSQFLFGGMALIFVGVIELWVKMVSTSDIKGAQEGIFSNLFNLGLLFAGPIAVFFIAWAAYLYITSQGDEGQVKHAKNIIVSTFLGIVLLLASYGFLKDLLTFLN